MTRSADALFELTDALLLEPLARSLPEISLSASFRRKWPSVYEVLEDGRIDEKQWQDIWASALLPEHQGPVWVSVDSNRSHDQKPEPFSLLRGPVHSSEIFQGQRVCAEWDSLHKPFWKPTFNGSLPDTFLMREKE